LRHDYKVYKNGVRLKNTLEYLGLWELLNNLAFKGVEFDPLLKDAGSNAFTMSPSRWVEFTRAIGIIAHEADLPNAYIILRKKVRTFSSSDF
jgi:hypothetical protein